MKITIFTPKYLPSINGNTTTVSRIVTGLKSKKIKTQVINISKLKNKQKALNSIRKFNPDIIHAFHSYKTGPIALEISKKLKKPLLVNVTGTDANHDLNNKKRKKAIEKVLVNAKKIIAFHSSIKARVVGKIPSAKSKFRIIKQSVKLERKKFDLRKRLNLSNKDFVFLLPAGIRKIKYQNFCIRGFKKIHSKHPNVKVITSGPILEKDFAKQFFRKIKNLDWFYHIEIPHDKIYYALKSVDVALNKSISEGGMSNAVLEALYTGKPVLASNIEGNRSVIKNNINGFLFSKEKDFIQKADKLVKNKKLRQRLGKKAKEFFNKNFSYKKEIDSYVKVYEKIIS